MTSTAGHELPPEAIAKIITELVTACDWSKSKLGGLELEQWAYKKWLRVCCLVCRYWAQICRPVMFRTLALRNGSDLDTLVALLSSPVPVVPRLADCVVNIEVAHTGPWDKPWLHRMFRIQQYATRKLDIRMKISTLREPAIVNLWSAALPRALPGSALLFSTLKLAGVRFQNVGNLIHAVRSLPGMRTVDCDDVSFVNEAINPEVIATHRRHQISQEEVDLHVQMHGCGGAQMEKELMFLLMSEMYCWRRNFVGQQVWLAFRKLVMALEVPSLIWPSLRVDVKPRSLKFSDFSVGALTLDMRQGSRPYMISISLEPRTTHLMSWDWAAIESTILGLGTGPVLHISVKTENAFKKMLPGVLDEKILQRLNSTGRLDLRFQQKDRTYISMQDVLAQPTEYNIGDRRVTLSATQRFALLLRKDEGRGSVRYARTP